jgi:RHS repeat-associated protein
MDEHHQRDAAGKRDGAGRTVTYDPLIGRFLSRDPYIDGVDSSQGANGYGYVHNNPLSRWDPTGYGAEDLDEIVVTGRRSRWRSVYLDEIARFLSQPFAGNAQGGGGAGGVNGATTPPAEPKEGGRRSRKGIRVRPVHLMTCPAMDWDHSNTTKRKRQNSWRPLAHKISVICSVIIGRMGHSIFLTTLATEIRSP